MQLRFCRFSDLYSFHKSHSSQVIILFNFRYILQMYQGVSTQCCGVAHNSRFSDLPQSVESFLFTFQYWHLWGIISIPILMPCAYGVPFHPNSRAQYGALSIPYICCFVWGIYHPTHFQWGIHSFHFLLLFIAHSRAYRGIIHPIYCCFVWGIYHPTHFQWGIHSSHFLLLFIAHCIFHHYGVYQFIRGTFHPVSSFSYFYLDSWGIISFP